MGAPRVLLCENDPVLAWLLLEVFQDEGIQVTTCGSLQEVHSALAEFPEAVVVSDPWSRSRHPELTPDERSEIESLANRARLILTTTRQWAVRCDGRSLGKHVTVLSKPFDLDVLISAVRAHIPAAPARCRAANA